MEIEFPRHLKKYADDWEIYDKWFSKDGRPAKYRAFLHTGKEGLQGFGKIRASAMVKVARIMVELDDTFATYINSKNTDVNEALYGQLELAAAHVAAIDYCENEHDPGGGE